MNRKYPSFTILLLTLLLICGSSMAQYDFPGAEPEKNQERNRKKQETASKFFFSPRLGFTLRSSEIYLEIVPLVGYKVFPRFWLGAGPEYMYFRSGSYHTSIYGASSFAYFAVLDNIQETINIGIGSIFLYLENEILSIQPYGQDRAWYDLLLGGAGVRIPVGSRMGISIMALWGLNKSTELLYSNPELRIMYDF